MIDFLDKIATASLPVAVGLFILAALARAALWPGAGDTRVAEEYLEPLATWCLIAVVVHTVALGGVGDLSVGNLALPVVLALGAALLRPSPAEAPPSRPAEPEPPPAEPARGLWSR